jgi:hypothetical protein
MSSFLLSFTLIRGMTILDAPKIGALEYADLSLCVCMLDRAAGIQHHTGGCGRWAIPFSSQNGTVRRNSI